MRRESLLFYCNDVSCLKYNLDLLNKFDTICVSQNNEIYGKKDIYDMLMLPYDSGCKARITEAVKIACTINRSFENVITRKPHYLYELNHLCEGGLTGAYAKYLYAADFFLTLVHRYNVDTIFCGEVPYSLEALALKDVAASKGIAFKFIKKHRGTKKRLKDRLFFSQNLLINIIVSIVTHFKCFADIKKIAAKNRVDKVKSNYDMGFILTSDLEKHINWLLEELAELERELNCCVFCYHADEAKEKLLAMGKIAKSIEAYYDAKTAKKSYVDYLLDCYAIFREVKKIRDVYFQSIDVSKTIYHMYITNLFREKLQDILYEGFVYSFLQKNHADLITGNGDTNYISTKIFYFNTKKLNHDSTFYKNVVGFDLVDCVKANLVHEPYSYIINLRFFIEGSTYLRALKNNGWKGKYYYLPYTKNASIFYKYKALREGINIKNPRILWAPSYPVQGQYPLFNFLEDNEKVIGEFIDLEVDLKIKYHPHQEAGQIEQFVKKYNDYGNIEFINRYENIAEYIETSDIVITTLSTVILDAAIRNKLVVCIVNELSAQFSDHLKDAFFFIKCEELNLKKILYDVEFQTEQMKKQNLFVEQKISNPNNKSIVDILKKYINQSEDNS